MKRSNNWENPNCSLRSKSRHFPLLMDTVLEEEMKAGPASRTAA